MRMRPSYSKRCYGFHPNKYYTMLHPANLIEMYNMMGTMASFPQRLKTGRAPSAAQYKDFLAHAEAIAKIRGIFKTEVGKEDEAAIECAGDRDGK